MADETEVKAEEPKASEFDFASDPKSIFKSKVFWGVVVALLGKYLKIDGVPDLANDLATVGGAALAIYGRIKATRSASISRPSN